MSIVNRMDQKAEFEEKNPKLPALYGWPYSMAMPLQDQSKPDGKN